MVNIKFLVFNSHILDYGCNESDSIYILSSFLSYMYPKPRNMDIVIPQFLAEELNLEGEVIYDKGWMIK